MAFLPRNLWVQVELTWFSAATAKKKTFVSLLCHSSDEQTQGCGERRAGVRVRSGSGQSARGGVWRCTSIPSTRGVSSRTHQERKTKLRESQTTAVLSSSAQTFPCTTGMHGGPPSQPEGAAQWPEIINGCNWWGFKDTPSMVLLVEKLTKELSSRWTVCDVGHGLPECKPPHLLSHGTCLPKEIVKLNKEEESDCHKTEMKSRHRLQPG